MAFTFGKYRSDVMKTQGTKSAKLGLRTLAKSTLHTNEAKAITGLNLATASLFSEMQPYLLGEQLTGEIKDKAASAMSAVGYNLVTLARLLKVKTPTATKKVKLTGTITAALLTFQGQASMLLHYVDGVFVGPAMKTEQKEVVNPAKKTKEVRSVFVVDASVEDAYETQRQEQLKKMVEELVTLYWKLSYTMLGVTPATLFEANHAELLKKFPTLALPPVVKEKAPAKVDAAKPKK